MNKLIISVIAACLCTTVQARDIDDKALKLANEYQNGEGSVIRGPAGRLLFVYGQSMPRIACAPLNFCDIALEQGERIQEVNGINLADTARWKIKLTKSGSGENFRYHALLKPVELDLSTTLHIATDRRSYMINLISGENNLGQVGFQYQDSHESYASETPGLSSLDAQVAAVTPPMPEAAPIVIEEPTYTQTTVIGSEIDFPYNVVGPSAPWKPIRAFQDKKSGKSFLDFDKHKMSSTVMPILMVHDIGMRNQVVNTTYDPSTGRLAVDAVFKHASLMVGTGRNKKRVSIVAK